MMSLVNKKRDMTPFDMQQAPCRQSPLLLPLIWAASWLQTKPLGLKIRKDKMKGFKPPYLLISAHQGFSDYAIAPLALFPHRAAYISDIEGFAAYGKALYRGIGCIAKRRFTPDYAVIRQIKKVLFENRDILVLFPEARHSDIGTNAEISSSVARLIRCLGVPVATLAIHGSYLTNPFWDETHTRKAKLEAEIAPCFTPEETQTLSEEEIMAKINRRLAYDEYAWQKANRIRIAEKKRAEGLHLPLYQCPVCKKEYQMASAGSEIFCRACGERWTLGEYGELEGKNFSHPPDWYEWQRRNTEEEAQKGEYQFSSKVAIEALPNEKGFLPLGTGRLTHTEQGFLLEGTTPLTRKNETCLFFPTRRLESIQTEYDYRKKGPCVVLSTRDCCYYLYPADQACSVTKIRFAAEYFYRKQKENAKSLKNQKI